MKRIQNWRDYLKDDNHEYTEKFSKKKKRKYNDEDTASKSKKTKDKRK